MKNPILLLAAIASLCLFSCQSSSSQEDQTEEPAFVNPLPGAWKMTGYLYRDSSEMSAPEFTQYKFYTDKHFYFVGYDEDTDTLVYAGGGTYEVTEDSLTEFVAYTSWDSTNVDLSYTFSYSIGEDGSFQQRGVMAATSPDEEDFQLAEDYEKVGPTLDSAAAQSAPVGLWKADKVAYGEDTEAKPMENGDVLYKLITPTHFYAVTYQEAEGRFRGMAFGTYEMKDGKYVEQVITTSWGPEMIGMTAPFDYELSADAFMQTAELTIGEETGILEEHFSRVE